MLAEILDYWFGIAGLHPLLELRRCYFLLPCIHVSAFAHDQLRTLVNRPIEGEQISIDNVA